MDGTLVTFTDRHQDLTQLAVNALLLLLLLLLLSACGVRVVRIAWHNGHPLRQYEGVIFPGVIISLE